MEIVLNLTVVDELVTDYLQSQQRPDAAEKECKRLCAKVRETVLKGDIDGAEGLLNRINPAILKDQRILFRLRRQKFLELFRRSDVGSALVHLRSSYAPLAMEAYPEAYDEFKRSLVAMVFSEDAPQNSLQEAAMRHDLAALLFSTARQSCGRELWLCRSNDEDGGGGMADGKLVLAVKYLCNLHNHHPPAGATDSGSCLEANLSRLLVPEERNPQPLPLEGFGRNFHETDVQAVIMAACIGRQQAVESLKRVCGNTTSAVQNELARLRLNRHLMCLLTEEYTHFRGLQAESSVQACQELHQTISLLASSSMPGTAGLWSSPDGSSSDDEPRPASSSAPAASDAPSSAAQASPDQRGPCPEPEAEEFMDVPQRSASRSPPHKIARRQLRPGMPTASGSGDASGAGEAAAEPACSSAKPDWRETLVAFLSKESNQTPAGLAGQLQTILAYDAQFFDGRPELLFDLYRLQVRTLVETGATLEALRIVRQKLVHLVPLMPSTLTAKLKEVLAELLPPCPPSGKAAHTQPQPQPQQGSPACGGGGADGRERQQEIIRLSHLLVHHLQQSMGVQEPWLLLLLKYLLAAHDRWFKSQYCEDRFADLLQVRRLVFASPTADTAAQAEPQNPEGRRCGAAEAGDPELQSPSAAASLQEAVDSEVRPPRRGFQVDRSVQQAFRVHRHAELELSGARSQMEVNEESVLRLMEMLALNRRAVIDLLIETGGNAQRAIDVYFS